MKVVVKKSPRFLRGFLKLIFGSEHNKGFFWKTLRMKTMKDFPKYQMNLDVFAWT